MKNGSEISGSYAAVASLSSTELGGMKLIWKSKFALKTDRVSRVSD
jgi:hypothetical protein